MSRCAVGDNLGDPLQGAGHPVTPDLAVKAARLRKACGAPLSKGGVA